MILIQEYFVTEKFLRPGNWQFWGLPRLLLPAPSDGSLVQHQMSSRLVPLLVLRLSPHAETSPQIETVGNGFKSLCFCLSSFWKCWGKVQILSQRDDKNSLFSNQQKCWWWLTRFSRSLTLAALKVALVTLSCPLWVGLRMSFQPKGNFHHKDWTLLQQESAREACLCKDLIETFSLSPKPLPGLSLKIERHQVVQSFGLPHQDHPPGKVSTATSPWIHQFSSDHWS